MSVCFFDALPSGEYSHFMIIAGFSKSIFFCKVSSPVKKSYLPTFSEDEAEIIAGSV